MPQINIKESVQATVLIVVFIFTLKFFQSTPFEVIFFQIQALFLALVFVYVTLYVCASLFNEEPLNVVIRYFLFLIVVIPFYSAFRATSEFGQPFVYGFLSERGWLLIGAAIWIYTALVRKKITLATVEFVFVFMTWVSLMFFSVFILTYDASQLQGLGDDSGMVNVTEDRGLRFKFQLFFIIFGSIYYFVKYATYKNFKDLVVLLALLAYVLFIVQGRSNILFLSATFLLYYGFNYSINTLIPVAIKLLFFVFTSIFLIYIFMPDYFSKMGYLFYQMFEVLRGEMSEDASANSRIFQSEIVYSYFDRNPFSLWLGTGSVSMQWHNGYASILGYFYPIDIGLLGGIFVYGVIGTIFICIIPIIINIKTIRKVSEIGDVYVFIITLKYLLIYNLIKLIQGSFYFSVMSYVLPLFILLAYIKLQERGRAR